MEYKAYNSGLRALLSMRDANLAMEKHYAQINLWDTFLDILAGGVHQSPSEHVMMERWIEGEKRDL